MDLDSGTARAILQIRREECQTMLNSIEAGVQAGIQKDRRTTLELQVQEIDQRLGQLDRHPEEANVSIALLTGFQPATRQRWVDCIRCTETLPEDETVTAPCDDRHIYCRPCIIRLFDLATSHDEELYPPRCCERTIPVNDTRSVIGGELAQKAEMKRIELATADRTYCSNP